MQAYVLFVLTSKARSLEGDWVLAYVLFLATKNTKSHEMLMLCWESFNRPSVALRAMEDRPTEHRMNADAYVLVGMLFMAVEWCSAPFGYFMGGQVLNYKIEPICNILTYTQLIRDFGTHTQYQLNKNKLCSNAKRLRINAAFINDYWGMHLSHVGTTCSMSA